MRFENKTAVVTGSGGGIGEAYARALHAEGANVVIAELDEGRGKQVADSLGERALFVGTDVGDPSSTDAMASATTEAFGGIDYLVNNAAFLLHHNTFMESASTLFNSDIVIPEQVFVNLSTPMKAQPFSHVDIPEFMGVTRRNAPGWFLQAMGSSRLFEDVRISIITIVAWFYEGERGFFRYWPSGRDNDSVRHEQMWNTAVAGDNDFMHHLVERVGPKGSTPPEGMTINTELSFSDTKWNVVEDGEVLSSFDDKSVRLSLSWKAKVFSDTKNLEDYQTGSGDISVSEAINRFNAHLGSRFSDLSDDDLRVQLTKRWSGYVV